MGKVRQVPKKVMQNDDSKIKKKKSDSFPVYANLLGLGMEMAVSMLFPIFGGYYLQMKFNFDPWGVVIGAVFGFFSAFWLVYKRVVLKK